MPKAIDMTGRRYASITVVGESVRTRDGGRKWFALCDCGKTFEAAGAKIRSGEVITCPPCSKERVRRARTKHGLKWSAEYRIWTHIKSRCYNEKVPAYKHYGGRGISMCDRWRASFENFLADMGPRPTSDHSIDRFPDKDGNYEPGNCRWATEVEQQNNRRNNRKITIGGQTKNMCQWADENGLRREAVYKRLKRGKVEESIIAKSKTAVKISFNGIEATIPEWSEITGIKTGTLYYRINDHNWPIEKALTKGAKSCK